MSENITLQVSGSPEALWRFLNGLESPEPKQEEPWWKTETPWFERHSKLTPEEAADMEAGFYGTGNAGERKARPKRPEYFPGLAALTKVGLLIDTLTVGEFQAIHGFPPQPEESE